MSSDFTVVATTDRTSVPDATASLALTIVTPIAIAFTSPVVDTVATPGFDDSQVAVVVTSIVVVGDGLSTAFSWPAWPTTNVSPPVKEIDGANAVDAAGVVACVAAVAAVVEGVVCEFEQAAENTTSRRTRRRATGITRHEHERCHAYTRDAHVDSTTCGDGISPIFMRRPHRLTRCALHGGHRRDVMISQ